MPISPDSNDTLLKMDSKMRACGFKTYWVSNILTNKNYLIDPIKVQYKSLSLI